MTNIPLTAPHYNAYDFEQPYITQWMQELKQGDEVLIVQSHHTHYDVYRATVKRVADTQVVVTSTDFGVRGHPADYRFWRKAGKYNGFPNLKSVGDNAYNCVLRPYDQYAKRYFAQLARYTEWKEKKLAAERREREERETVNRNLLMPLMVRALKAADPSDFSLYTLQDVLPRLYDGLPANLRDEIDIAFAQIRANR